MPTVMNINGIKFLFYSDDHEPIHVHLRYGGNSIRIELGTWNVTKNKGFKDHEITKAVKLVQKHEEVIKEAWNEYFSEEEDREKDDEAK